LLRLIAVLLDLVLDIRLSSPLRRMVKGFAQKRTEIF